MNHSITLKDFTTDLYAASFMNKRCIPLSNDLGFIKNSDEVVLFNIDDLQFYLCHYNKIKVYGLSKEQYQDFRKCNIHHNLMKQKHTILRFDSEFFNLRGKNYTKIRYYKNYYQNKIRIEEKAGTLTEVEEFIRQWKKIRQNAYHMFFIGYDINFLYEYYKNNQSKMISRFFYFEDRLVAFFIVERISNNLYNQLFRKANTNFGHLCLYVDYICFKTIFDEIKKPFLINLEGDIARSGLSNYKKENFPDYEIINSYDVKINKGI